MIKNVKLKVFVQNTVFNVFSMINKYCKHDDKTIMLYSNMGFRDNIKAFYDYLIEEGYNEKYRIICSTNDYKKYNIDSPKNVEYISNVNGILKYFSVGYTFYAFGKIPIIPGKNQKSIQFWHGAPFKAPDEGMLKGHSWNRQYYTHVLSTSEHFKDNWSYCFSMPKDKMLISGQPRNDELFKTHKIIDFGKYDYLVLWTPTFRKSATMGYSDTKGDNEIVPILKPEEFEQVNEYLKRKNIKVIVKLHPLQDLGKYKNINMDYFILLSHSEFLRRGMELYKFMPQCDAMITDYSSIFYDFLLLDKPIAFTEDDMKDYGDTRGFAFKNADDYKPGMRIKSKNDFFSFIDSLANNIDEYKQERDRVNDLANDFRCGGYCKRICDELGIVK